MRGGSSRSLFIRKIVDVPLVKLHSLAFAIFFFFFCLVVCLGVLLLGFFWFWFGLFQ